MRIAPISYSRTFTGKKERDDFRQSAKEVLKELKDVVPGSLEYTFGNTGSDSVKFKLTNTLFNKTQKVGKKYATLQDRILLKRLKDAYVEYQQRADALEVMLGCDKSIADRKKEVKDITF